MLTFRKSTRPSASKRAPISAASCAVRPRRGPSSSSPTRRSPTASRPPRGVAHRLEHLDAEAHAVLERAAVGVGPLVAARREELVDQVAVGAVDLDAVEAAGRRVARAAREVGDQLADLLDLERLRRLVVVRDRARRPGGQPRPGAVVDAAVVGELEERERAGGPHRAASAARSGGSRPRPRPPRCSASGRPWSDAPDTGRRSRRRDRGAPRDSARGARRRSRARRSAAPAPCTS